MEQRSDIWLRSVTKRPFPTFSLQDLWGNLSPSHTDVKDCSLLICHSERAFSYFGRSGNDTARTFLTGLWTESASEGYKDVVIHVSLLEVVHDAVLADLAEQDHVIHAAVFDIVALPVVPVVAPAPLKQKTHNAQLLVCSEKHNGVNESRVWHQGGPDALLQYTSPLITWGCVGFVFLLN